MIEINGNAVNVQLKDLEKNLGVLDKEIVHHILYATSNATAAKTRNESAKAWFTEHYSLRGGKTDRLKVFKSSGNWSEQRSRKGRRLFGFKAKRLGYNVTAYLTSFPVNWYERDVTVPVGRSNRRNPYTRPGTHLFERMTPIAARILEERAGMAAEELRNDIGRMFGDAGKSR